MTRLLLAFFAALMAAAPADAQLTTAPGGGGGGASVPATSDFVVNGGIGVRILFIGRNPDGQRITVSAQLVNQGDKPINIALIPPKPAAIDDRGITYKLESIAGAPQCRAMNPEDIAGCVTGYSNWLPNENFARLDAGANSVAALTFVADQVSDAGRMSLALSFAVVPGDAVTEQSRKQARNVPVTFPLIDLARTN